MDAWTLLVESVYNMILNSVSWFYQKKTCFFWRFFGHILFKRWQRGRGCFSSVKLIVFSFQEDFKSQNDVIATLRYHDTLSIAICVVFLKKTNISSPASVDPPHLSIKTWNFITSALRSEGLVPKAGFVIEKIWDQYKKKKKHLQCLVRQDVFDFVMFQLQHTFCDLSAMMKGQHVGQGLCD